MKLVKTGLIVLAIGIVSAIVTIIAYRQFQVKDGENADPDSFVTQTPTSSPSPTALPTPEIIDYSSTTTAGGENYIELSPKIEDQQAYIAYPRTILKDEPPAIVVYYHGSTQQITTNFKQEVMKNMRIYGEFFANKNIAFLASNQHGDNWGNKVAVEDTRKLIAWVKQRYLTSGTVYVFAFSMGGMPAMRHVIMYPKEVKRIALLAPAQQVETYTAAQIKLFRQVPLKVWHGTSDVNVPYWVTEELQTYFKKYDVPLEVVKLKGKTHWDVDTEYRQGVYEWLAEEAK